MSRITHSVARWIAVLALMPLLVACGGGGGGGGSSNQPPVASFTASPSEGSVPLIVAFSAAASSDPDGSILAYAWSFGDGASGSGVSITHTYSTAGTFTVTLTVTDNRGATGSTTRTVTAGPAAPPVTVSGRITFERVPFTAALGGGLDYPATFEAPAREVDVEIIQAADQSVLASTVTDTDGRYSVSAPANTTVFVRARAASRHVGTPDRPASWNLSVRNNASNAALYVLDGSAFSTGTANQTRNLKAATGWGGSLYVSTRAAGPFAVLDTLYSAAQLVVGQGDANAQLPALVAYWSVKNVATDGNVTTGQIGTTAYYPAGTPGIATGIYVLGAADNTMGDPVGIDTDEFDQHVVAHEFMHYIEDTISRTDTVGGPHSLDERLDMRVAFSEGYANAFSAMVFGDPVYRDSYGTAQGLDSHFNMETRTTVVPGWYTETSVHRIIWDLFDNAADGVDTVALGYGPLHDVFVTELKDGVPLTSLFPFIAALKQRTGVPAAQVDRIVEAEGIAATDFGIVSATIDAYASTETHGGGSESSLPIYSAIAVGGSQTVCADRVLGTYNALGNRRFLRFTAPARQTITVRVECVATATSNCTGTPAPDPDLVLTHATSRWVAEAEGTVETLGPLTVDAGDYVIEVYEYSHIDPSTLASRRGRTCMRVTLSTP